MMHVYSMIHTTNIIRPKLWGPNMDQVFTKNDLGNISRRKWPWQYHTSKMILKYHMPKMTLAISHARNDLNDIMINKNLSSIYQYISQESRLVATSISNIISFSSLFFFFFHDNFPLACFNATYKPKSNRYGVCKESTCPHIQ